MGHALGKDNDGIVSRQGVDNTPDPLQRHVLVVSSRAEGTGRIKDLQGISSGRDFHLEEIDHRRGDFLHE